MYHWIVRSIAKKNFLRINNREFDKVLYGCDANIVHQFGGHHSLGGTRRDRHHFKLWLERLARLMPNMKLTVHNVWVTGWPHDTFVFVRWTNEALLLNGEAYRNRGVHVIRMKWGKVVEIDANEDSQLVAEGLQIQGACGLLEALSLPIIS